MNNAAINKSSKKFSVHPALIYTIITRQASGIHKAFLELAMNSVDAGATRIDLMITPHTFTFSDNGCGFKDNAQIISCFETFGTPHADGDAEYGRYRLGRAQLFSYGKSTWYSKNMRMVVDLKKELDADDQDVLLGYKLSTHDKYFDGCTIEGEFYEQRFIGTLESIATVSNHHKPENIHGVIPSFAKCVKYLPVDIFINGEKVNKNISELPVTDSTDDAVFILREHDKPNSFGCINVYNKGVYAYQLPSEFYVGDVISIDNIDLNIARNAPKTTCPVASSIKKRISILDQRVRNRGMKNRNIELDVLNYDTKSFVKKLWEGILGFSEFDSDLFSESMQAKVFMQGNDTTFSLADIFTQLEKRRKRISMSNESHQKQFTLAYYDQAILSEVSQSKEILVLGNGFIPSVIFPDLEFIQSLNGEFNLDEVLVLPYLKEVKDEAKKRRWYDEEWLQDGINRTIKATRPLKVDFTALGSTSLQNVDFGRAYQLLLTYLMNFYAVFIKINKTGYGLSDFSYQTCDPSILYVKPFTQYPLREVSVQYVLNFGEEYKPKPVKLTEYQKIVLSTLSRIAQYGFIKDARWQTLGHYVGGQREDYIPNKRIEVNVFEDHSHDALAWTNGIDQIAFSERYFVDLVERGGFDELVITLLHELSHHSNSIETTVHGATFYQMFRNLAVNGLDFIMDAFYHNLMAIFYQKITRASDLDRLKIPKDVFKKLCDRQAQDVKSNFL